jgi:PilZ domain-containing protein
MMQPRASSFVENGSNQIMSQIMDVLKLGRCSHEFSWPRRGADGNYYQVCLLCAAEYEYDWSTMRRTERVERPTPETGIRRNHPREKRPSWKPRARRVKLDLPLRYRVNHTSPWFEGTIENISQSGVLFHGQEPLPLNSLLEMVFEMPEEISGQKNSNVICQGRVTRSTDDAESAKDGVESSQVKSGQDGKQDPDASDAREQIAALAASIVDYKFVR